MYSMMIMEKKKVECHSDEPFIYTGAAPSGIGKMVTEIHCSCFNSLFSNYRTILTHYIVLSPFV
jgi:hypothetical protein